MWIENNTNDFAKGKLENVSVHSSGELTLSPHKSKIKEIPAAYVWCLATDETDSIFAGTGDPGSIFKITQNDVIEFYKTSELHVHTIAIDASGNIYAGTLPHGRIYKITSDGKGKIFCELPDPYVWDMVFDGNGDLYVASGNNGIIYKISEEGVPSVFFDSQYSNILDLVVDKDNNIYAACEPEGLIYRITTNGKASVLYDAEEDEVHCLAIDKNGILYAGTSSGIPPVLPTPRIPTKPEIQPPPPIEEFPYETNNVMPYDVISNTNTNNSKRPSAEEDHTEDKIEERPITAKINSIYRIDKEGKVKEIFTAERVFILCLAVDSNNDILVGTGNKAKLFKIDSNDEEIALLYDFYESQILDVLPHKNGRKYIATGNNASVHLLSNKYSNKGSYESVIHDALFNSLWGCISWKGNIPSHTNITLSTRSGNSKKPDITWSDWSKEGRSNGEKIKSPPARFIQYRVNLTTDNTSTTPVLDNISIAYLPQNQTPIIRSIKINSSGNSNKKKNKTSNNKTSTTPPYPPERHNRAGSEKDKTNYGLEIHEPKKIIKWEADDPNYDRLRFDLEYKSVDESKWKELKRNINGERKYYWNTNRIPDGYYQVKVIARDDPDNPIELSLKEEKVSNTFIVDNTRPTLSDLKKIKKSNNTLIISGVARDEISHITEIQYSLDSEEWSTVFPVDLIFDAKEESFILKIPYFSSEEYTVVINAIDAEGNIGSNRIVFNP
ncbi:MAG: hypothetical protein ACE5KZ_04235 [Candidatus Scalinduaceae bacterium]